MTSIREALRASASAIAAAGIGDTPRLDAELLVGHVMHLDRAALRIYDDRELDRAQERMLESLVARRVAHEPVQYLLGTAWFYGLDFTVDRRVLIPRPETELLVDLALEELERRGAGSTGQPLHVVDACSGSGCVAIAIAVEAERRFGHGAVVVTGTDIDTGAIDVATSNAARLAPEVAFVQGSLLEPVSAEVGEIDIIVSNPPYVPLSDASSMAPSVVDHEPHVALFVPDDDPLTLLRTLASQASDVLVAGGFIAVEHGIGQRERVSSALADAGFDHNAQIDDLAGIDRIVTAYLGARDGEARSTRGRSSRDGRPIDVRPLVPTDVPAFVDLAREVIADGRGVPQVDGEPLASPDRLAREWAPDNDESCYLGVFHRTTGAMLAEASLRRIGLQRLDHVAIVGLSVRPSAQGIGLGRLLMEELLAWARANQLHRIELNVFADNERAISLYRSLGFVTEGRRRDFLQRADGSGFVDDLTMGLLLGDA